MYFTFFCTIALMENKWMVYALTRIKVNILMYGSKFNYKTSCRQSGNTRCMSL